MTVHSPTRTVYGRIASDAKGAYFVRSEDDRSGPRRWPSVIRLTMSVLERVGPAAVAEAVIDGSPCLAVVTRRDEEVYVINGLEIIQPHHNID